MPWNDCVFEDWEDCKWQDWDDCEWDKFSSRDRRRQRRTPRLLGPEAIGDYGRRPQLEGNPGYVEDTKRYSDKAFADAMLAKGEEVRHLEFKQPYRYDSLQKMKYKNEPAFAHQGMQDVATPMGILGQELDGEWRWVRYFDDSRWTPSTGEWFDNRWLEDPDVATWVQHLDDSDWYDYYYSLGGVDPQIVWDGAKWDIGVWNGTALQELGTWVESYRPTHIKINYTGALQYKLIDSADDDIVTQATYTSGQAVEITWGANAIKRIKFYFDANDTITNIEFGTIILGGLDLAVVLDGWWKDLRPKKFRMKFDEATADVSLQDKNGTELYANATYASTDEVYLDFAGAEDISRLVVSGSGDITDLEFLVRIETGSDPDPIQGAERKPRREDYRATKTKRERYVKDKDGHWVKVLY